MPLIVISIITIYAVYIAWTYYNMNQYENNKKVYFILFGIIISFIITNIVINLNRIDLSNIDVARTVNTVNLMLFTPLNALIVFPSIAKKMNKFKADEISKDEMKKQIILNIIIFLILLVLEGMYIKDIGNTVFIK